MKKSLITRIAAVAAASIVLAACSGGGDGGSGGADAAVPGPGEVDTSSPVTLTFTWWGNDDRAAKYNEALALFKEDYPHITVQPTFSPFPDYWTSRNTEAAGSALPDVMQFDSSYIREYASTNRLLDLNPYVESGLIDLANFDESLVASGNLDGKQVAIPASTNTLAMFINPEIRDAIGVEFLGEGYTYEDFNDYVLEAYEADVSNAEGHQLYGGGDYTATFWFFLQWCVQQGKQPFTEDGQLAFTEEDVTEYLSLTQDLRDAGALYPIARGVSLAPKGGFTANEMAAEGSWDNFLAGYSADSGSEIDILPIWSGENGTQNFLRPSMLFTSGANSKNPDEAALLINFLLTDPRVGEIFGTSKGVPADSEQRAAIVAEEGSIDAKVLAYEESVTAGETSTAPIPVKGFGTIEEKWRNLGEELNYGNITIEQFVSEWWAEAEMAVS